MILVWSKQWGSRWEVDECDSLDAALLRAESIMDYSTGFQCIEVWGPNGLERTIDYDEAYELNKPRAARRDASFAQDVATRLGEVEIERGEGHNEWAEWDFYRPGEESRRDADIARLSATLGAERVRFRPNGLDTD